MTDQQREVHLRLLAELPVRTHSVPIETSTRGGGRVRTDAECKAMRVKIRAMRAKLSVAKIAEKLDMSPQTVYNYLRKHR